MAESSGKSKAPNRTLVVLIGIFKIIKGCLMLLATAMALGLLSTGVEERVRGWSQELGVAPYRRRLGEWISEHVLRLSHRGLVGVALIALLYAGLFFTEGLGLLFDKLWAEWLTVVSTGLLLIPEGIEIYERRTAIRIGILIANIATVIYLFIRARGRMRTAKKDHQLDKSAQPQVNSTGV